MVVDRNFVDLVVLGALSVVVLDDPGVSRLTHGTVVHLDVEVLLLHRIATLLDQLSSNVC